MSQHFRTLVSRFDFLESPRWRQGTLWVSDFYTRRVLAVDEEGGVEIVCEIGDQPSGLGWLPDGRLLLVAMNERKVLRREHDGSMVVHADLSELTRVACNDMAVDARGRAYVGHFGFDLMSWAPLRTASIVLVQPDGAAREVAGDLYFPNGSVITPDGRTLIVNETFGNRVSAFDILADGSLGPRRDWAVFGPVPEGDALAEVVPQMVVGLDGATLDADGCLWVADSLRKRVLRVREGGEILAEAATGELAATACALGGEQGDTLFVCVAPDANPESRRGAGESSVLTTKVAVPGACAS